MRIKNNATRTLLGLAALTMFYGTPPLLARGFGEKSREPTHEFQFKGNQVYLTKVNVRGGLDYYCVADSTGKKLNGRQIDELRTMVYVGDDKKDTVVLSLGGFYLNGERLR